MLPLLPGTLYEPLPLRRPPPPSQSPLLLLCGPPPPLSPLLRSTRPQLNRAVRVLPPCPLQVVVVVNKVDRPAARCDWVIDQTFELFMDLGATDEQCGEPGTRCVVGPFAREWVVRGRGRAPPGPGGPPTSSAVG